MVRVTSQSMEAASAFGLLFGVRILTEDTQVDATMNINSGVSMFNYIQAIPEHQNTNHPIRLTKATCYPQQDTTVENVTDNKAKGNDTEQLPKNGGRKDTPIL